MFRHRRGGRHTGDRRPVLRVLLLAGRPFDPPSRHLIDGVDQIEIGRGPRAATRQRGGGLARLVLRVPDPIMSAEHGRLVRAHGQWILDDPDSKNGSVVAGRPTRSAPVHPGDLVELGHTLFVLDEEALPADAPPDLLATELAAPRPELATFDPDLARDVDRLSRVAASDVPVLVLGESGTGKEVIARAVHELSGRRGPFVAVNCGGLVSTLVEAELFGHRKGAFSGAIADRVGYLRAAGGGTLFLDELGDLPLPAQIALLRALQERAVTPVGDTSPIDVDFRVCAATHRDLAQMVAAGTFREDLYARLLGVTVTLPPLRERKADLGLLVGRLLGRLPHGERACFTPAAAYALYRYRWPLNVRELDRVLVAALALAGRDPIDVEHLPAAVASCLEEDVAAPAGAGDPAEARPDAGDDALRGELIAALIRHGGNVAAAARELGKHREQIHRWARRFGIDLESFRR